MLAPKAFILAFITSVICENGELRLVNMDRNTTS